MLALASALDRHDRDGTPSSRVRFGAVRPHLAGRSLLEGDLVKYMIVYEIRTAGLSHDQNFANQQALIDAFGKRKPEEGLTVHEF